MDFSNISGIRQFGDRPMVPPNANQSLGQEDFLRLMIAQLQNQDPFEPMENGDFLGQMAQFSTVSGIRDLQSSFDSAAQVMAGTQSLQAASLVNRSALVQSGSLVFNGTEPAKGALDVPPGALNAEVVIRDAGGALVARVPAAVSETGRASFSWDGRGRDGQAMPPGSYTITGEVRVGNQSQAAPTLVWARIDSVSLGTARSGGITINLAGLGPVPLGQAREFA